MSGVPNRRFVEHAREVLVDMTASAGTAPWSLVPEDLGVEYRRTLVYGDPADRFGIWALWWPPASATPIHDHHCDCVFSVVRGVLTEAMFERGAQPGLAVPREVFERSAGFVGGGPFEASLIHRMGNPTQEVALSLHAYAYAPASKDSSILQCFATSGASGSRPPAAAR